MILSSNPTDNKLFLFESEDPGLKSVKKQTFWFESEDPGFKFVKNNIFTSESVDPGSNPTDDKLVC